MRRTERERANEFFLQRVTCRALFLCLLAVDAHNKSFTILWIFGHQKTLKSFTFRCSTGPRQAPLLCCGRQRSTNPRAFTHNQTRRICEDFFFKGFLLGLRTAALLFCPFTHAASRHEDGRSNASVSPWGSRTAACKRSPSLSLPLPILLFTRWERTWGSVNILPLVFGTPEEAGAQRKPAHWPVAARRGQFLCQRPGRRGVREQSETRGRERLILGWEKKCRAVDQLRPREREGRTGDCCSGEFQRWKRRDVCIVCACSLCVLYTSQRTKRLCEVCPNK